MATEMNEQQLQEKLSTKFKQLPKVVQEAILSADVETHMRQLAEHHQLHFDQWTALENEVMFALLGFEPVENLAANLEKEVGVSHEISLALAQDISEIIFAPIRSQLESALSQQPPAPTPAPPVAPPVTPGTPSTQPPEVKAIRAPISENYQAQQVSHERKSVEGDPYRESTA